jgi:hypothetical protein
LRCPANAADHVILEDADSSGIFAREAGSSVTTSLHPALPPDGVSWRVAGRSPCGVIGPL